MKNDPLLMEIQDEINRENMVRFVNKYAKLLVITAIAVFIGVAAFQFWKQYRTELATKAGSEIFAVEQSEKHDEFALKTLENTSHTPGYYEVSLLNKAQLQINNNDFPGAITSFDAVAKNGDNKPMRDLAALNAANLLLNSNPKADGLEKRLTAITDDNNSYKYNTRELLAVYYIQNNNNQKAGEILGQLAKDPSVPITIAKRARQLLAQITVTTDDATENEDQ